MTRRFAHAQHPAVDLRTPLHLPDEGMVNGRPAADFEKDIQVRARAAALAAETSALFTGVSITDRYSE